MLTMPTQLLVATSNQLNADHADPVVMLLILNFQTEGGQST